MSSEGVSSLYLWGCGWDGRLGNGSSENELLPYEVSSCHQTRSQLADLNDCRLQMMTLWLPFRVVGVTRRQSRVMQRLGPDSV